MTSGEDVPARWQQRKRETRARLEHTSLRMFVDQGFEDTTVEQLAEAAGIGRRTFFRYFPSKNDIVFGAFDDRKVVLFDAVEAAAAGTPPVEVVRQAMKATNDYGAGDYVTLAIRIWLITTVPSLLAHAARLYRSWEEGLRSRLRSRTGGDALYADALARTAIAVMWAAYDAWLEAGAGADLATHIDAAFDALGRAFVPPQV